jgi:hypothetical protein
VPIPFAFLVAFALGAAFARAAEGEIARTEGPLVASRPMVIVLAFAGLVLLPVAGYFTAFHGDWAYLYLAPWQSVPSAVDLMLVIAAAACVPGGFVATVTAIRGRRTQAVAALIGAPVAIAIVLALVCAKRLAVSASAAQYAGGFGVEPIAASALGKGVVWGMIAMAAGVAWAVRALRAAPR